MNVREKIKAADKATDTIINAWHTAENQLTGGVNYNGHGVLWDPQSTIRSVRAARDALDKAIVAYNETAWPTEHDYDSLEDC